MTTSTQERPADVDNDGTVPENETEEQRKARELEKLNRATVSLSWKGVEFRIPKRRGRWNIDAVREFGRDNYIEGLVALIGEDGWARLRTVCKNGDELNQFSDYAGSRIRTSCVP